MESSQKSGRESNSAGAIEWILTAFVLLAMGVILGAFAAGKTWAWAIPLAGVVGYLLAFRRALLALVLSSEIDGVWRTVEGSEHGRRAADSPGQGQARRPAKLLRGTFPITLAGPTATKHLKS